MAERVRPRVLALVVALAGSVLAVAAAAAPAARLPTVLTQIGPGSTFAVRPAQIIFTGDGSGILGGFRPGGPNHHFGRLTWTRWSRREADGHGAVWLDDCEPNCAQGTFHAFAVKVRALDPRHGHFTVLTLRYTFAGKRVVDRRTLLRHGSSYSY